MTYRTPCTCAAPHPICGNCERPLAACSHDPCTMVYPVCRTCAHDLAPVAPATSAERPQGYRAIFPDYDNGDTADLLIAAGWQDRSWINEACPSFQIQGASEGFHLFLEYVDPAKRDEPEMPLVGVYRLDGDGCFTGEDGDYYGTLREALAALYVARIGYDPFADSPDITEAEVARTLAEHAALDIVESAALPPIGPVTLNLGFFYGEGNAKAIASGHVERTKCATTVYEMAGAYHIYEGDPGESRFSGKRVAEYRP